MLVDDAMMQVLRKVPRLRNIDGIVITEEIRNKLKELQ